MPEIPSAEMQFDKDARVVGNVDAVLALANGPCTDLIVASARLEQRRERCPGTVRPVEVVHAPSARRSAGYPRSTTARSRSPE